MKATHMLCRVRVRITVMALGMLILQWTGIIFLVSLSALFAGLTLGLMSLDITGLEVINRGEFTT